MAPENIRRNVALAHGFADEMQRAEVSPAEGCFILAMTYGIWLDACDEADVERCDAMLRMLHEAYAQLADEALRSAH
jgi:hypothetical protein